MNEVNTICRRIANANSNTLKAIHHERYMYLNNLGMTHEDLLYLISTNYKEFTKISNAFILSIKSI